MPKEFFGRAMSVWMAFSMAMQVASTYGAGRLMDAVPANLGFLFLAAIMAVGLIGAGYFMARSQPAQINVFSRLTQ